MVMKLHCFGESGNAYKAALTLELSGAEWEPIFVDFFNGATRTPEFRALNVMGEVPVLEDGDLILTQSAVIQDYVSSKTGNLGGRSAAERRDVLRWMFFPRNDCYHLVHHLFPHIPARHLGASHQLLTRDALYAAQPNAVRHAQNSVTKGIVPAE